MLVLVVGEEIKECRSLFECPTQNVATEYCHAPQCERIGYRLIVIESRGRTRTLVLCGLHFLEACRDCKQLEVAEWYLLSNSSGLHRIP
jgi:hypothetical protein